MTMTSRGIVNPTEKRDADVKGAGIVSTVSTPAPSVNDGAAQQSPSGLKQSKTPSVVGTFSGAEGKQS